MYRGAWTLIENNDESTFVLDDTFVISKGYETVRGLYSLFHNNRRKRQLIDAYAAVIKMSLELVQYINGTLVMTRDENLRSKVVTIIMDDVLFVGEDVGVNLIATGRNRQEYNFLYCVPPIDIYVSSSTAFFLPFDLTTWILTVTSGVAVAAVLSRIYKVKLLYGLLAALATPLYQSMGSSVLRKHATSVLWSLCCLILSSLYLCFIEALFIGITPKGIGSLKELLNKGYVISFPNDYDSNEVKILLDACEEVFNCVSMLGEHKVTTFSKEVQFDSYFGPEFHKFLTEHADGPVMYVNERPKIRAMVARLNSRFKPLGITCLEGKNHTNFPAHEPVFVT